MVSSDRNLSQKLVVEERRTREYFTGNVTAEGLINAEIDTDYGARPLTPSQARFAAKALEDLADCADEKNEEEQVLPQWVVFYPPIDYRQINTILRSAAATIGRNPSGYLDTHHRHHTIGLVIHLSETRNTVTARTFSVRIRVRPRGKDMS